MGFFGLSKPTQRHDDLELLTTAYDNEQLAVLRSILESGNIPYMTKERGSGSSVKIIMGFSHFGTDIFVKRDRLEDARALLDATFADEQDVEQSEDQQN